MPSQTTPPVTIAKPQGGVLPISAVTDKNPHARPLAQKQQPQQKTKVVLRRLPPGITRAEVEAALGDDWKLGAGKVAWADFKPGKISKDIAKPSRPARVYIQVTDPSHLDQLQQTVAHAAFADAHNTGNDAVLIGPPALEYAPYGRIPASKRRNDARQGTIDQDPEFIEFLESLTNPITKPKALDGTASTKDEPVTTTPLIQHLREKKANKEKAASAKAAKKQESKDASGDAKPERKRGKDAEKGSAEDKKAAKGQAAERQPKDGVKNVSRREKTRPTATSTMGTSIANGSTSALQSAPASKRPEGLGPGSAAARLIQRDLGLRGGRGGGRAQRGGGRASNDARPDSPAPVSATEAVPAASASPKPAAKENVSSTSATRQAATTTQGRASGAKSSTPATTGAASSATKPSQPPSSKRMTGNSSAAAGPASQAALPDESATRAFIKNAHEKSGVTEAALRSALSEFGPVASIEQDRRRGFAFATFSAPGALRAAVAAGSVRVGEATVHVAERRERGGTASAAARETGPGSATAAGGGNNNGKDKDGPGARHSRGSGTGGRGNGGGRRGGGRGGNGGGGNANGGAVTATPAAADGV